MHRHFPLRSRIARSFAATTACILLACTSVAAADLPQQGIPQQDLAQSNRFAFTSAQLQAQLDRSFPRDYAELGGLVTLRIANPRLAIPANGHRLHLEFDVGIGTLGQTPDASAGRMAISSGLRFDPATHGLYLDQPTLESADFPGLGGAMNANGRELANQWLDGEARDEPIYRLDDSLVESLGNQRIQSTSIDDGQVVVHMGQ